MKPSQCPAKDKKKGKKSERRVKGRERKVKVKTAVSLLTPPPKKKHHSGKKLLSGYHRESLHAPHKLTRMRVSGKPSHLPSIDFEDHNNKLW